MEALRHATSARHEAIESLLGLRSPFGIAHYGRVLQGFGAFLAAWEPRMAQRVRGQAFEQWFEDGRRLHLLQRDLQSLGLKAEACPERFLPGLGGVPEVIGSLYVLEGSALGGQFIASRAHRMLGLSPARGTAYFHGAGSGTVSRWREFQQIAAAHLDGVPQACDRAARAAGQTFDGLTALFRESFDERAVA
jgi:heme oxygenase